MAEPARRRHGAAHEDHLMLILGLYHAGFNDGDIKRAIGCSPGRERQRLGLPCLTIPPGALAECVACGARVEPKTRRSKCWDCGARGRQFLRYYVARNVLYALSRSYPHTYEAMKADAIHEWPWLERGIERWEEQGRMRHRYAEPRIDAGFLRGAYAAPLDPRQNSHNADRKGTRVSAP